MTKLTQMSADNENTAGGLKSRRIHLREISGDSESPLETVGQDLRAARLRRGDEIAQVSRALKIRKDHLEALEEDRLEDLPGKTYAIGFIRSYARHLGLDSNVFVERFKQEISGRAEDHSREPAPIHQEEGRRLPQGWRIIAGVVAVLLIYGGYHLLSSGGESSQQTPPAPVIVPPKPAPKPVVVPQQAATPSPATDSATPTTAAPDTATPSPAAGPQTPATQLGTAPKQPPAPSNGEVYGKGNADPHVILRVRADTRVTVKGDDGQLYLNRDLKAGDVYQVPNTPGLSMATSNAAGVEVDIDGKSLGRTGAPGQVLGRVSLDPQSLAGRFNTH